MDWKNIKPLTETESISIISNYFSNHKFDLERVNTENIVDGQRSPDIVGKEDGNNVFLCEVKTPEHIFNENIGLYLWSTTFNKLRSRIHTAVKQFEGFDKKHLFPRIVAFASDHPQLNWTHLQHNILGAVQYGDRVLQDFRNKTFVVDTDNDIQLIDVFLWFQVNYINRNSIVELAIYQNANSALHEDVEKLVSKLAPYKKEGIQAPRYSALK